MALSVRVWVAAWAAWEGQDQSVTVGGAVSVRPPLPASLRRRVTAVGRKALEAAWAVLPEQGSPRFVLASRHGEYDRTFGLLGELAQSDEVSPAEFSLAVHHALAGLLSIATGNRQGHTAVAAGSESFGYGLLEAATFVAEQGVPAVLFYFDQPLPDSYAPVMEGDCVTPMVLALRLVPPSWPQARPLEMSLETRAGGGDCLSQAFLAVLQNGGEGLAQGRRHAWRWRDAA
nr:beta-ketoacyl synthase chain length factor [Magnetospirillum sulfuroxidans]